MPDLLPVASPPNALSLLATPAHPATATGALVKHATQPPLWSFPQQGDISGDHVYARLGVAQRLVNSRRLSPPDQRLLIGAWLHAQSHADAATSSPVFRILAHPRMQNRIAVLTLSGLSVMLQGWNALSIEAQGEMVKRVLNAFDNIGKTQQGDMVKHMLVAFDDIGKTQQDDIVRRAFAGVDGNTRLAIANQLIDQRRIREAAGQNHLPTILDGPLEDLTATMAAVPFGKKLVLLRTMALTAHWRRIAAVIDGLPRAQQAQVWPAYLCMPPAKPNVDPQHNPVDERLPRETVEQKLRASQQSWIDAAPVGEKPARQAAAQRVHAYCMGHYFGQRSDKTLDFMDMYYLSSLPDLPANVETVMLADCNNIDLSNLDRAVNLKTLHVTDSTVSKPLHLPKSIAESIAVLDLSGTPIEVLNLEKMSKLREFSVNRCSRLRSLPALPPSIKVLSVDGNAGIDLSGLAHLQNLRELSARNCDLRGELQLPESLEKLSVDDNENMDWENVARLPKLKELSAARCDLNGFVPPRSLEILTVDRSINFDPSTFPVLPNLRVFNALSCQLSSLPILGSAIEEINVSINNKMAWKNMAGLPKLKELSAARCDLKGFVPPPSLEILTVNLGKNIDSLNFSTLTKLRIFNATDSNLSRLPVMGSAIEEINVSFNPRIDLSNLRNLTNLRRLDVSRCALQGRFDFPPTLETLDVSWNPEIDLSTVQNLPHLKVLVAHGCNWVGPLPLPSTIEELDVSRIQGLDLASFSGLPKLKTLRARNCGFAGPLHLPSTTEIVGVSNNEGIDLSTLADLPNLTVLSAAYCGLTGRLHLPPTIEQVFLVGNPGLDTANLSTGNYPRLARIDY